MGGRREEGEGEGEERRRAGCGGGGGGGGGVWGGAWSVGVGGRREGEGS